MWKQLSIEDFFIHPRKKAVILPGSKLRKIVSKVIVRKIPVSQRMGYGEENMLG